MVGILKMQEFISWYCLPIVEMLCQMIADTSTNYQILLKKSRCTEVIVKKINLQIGKNMKEEICLLCLHKIWIIYLTIDFYGPHKEDYNKSPPTNEHFILNRKAFIPQKYIRFKN